jgi:glycosyltransferase involved in cell wall biosynthesis
MNRRDRRAFIEGMARRRRLLLAADLVTVSTAYLARMVEKLGRPSLVIPNSINAEQLRVAADIAVPSLRCGGHVRIAYLSGSPTHQKDFRVCENVLLALLARHSQVRFRLVGYLDLGPHWERYQDRVEQIGFLSAADMLRCLGEVDINLAPLELGNPFCEAKSELKFFEAGLAGVPTVASATETFVAAIEDGVSGFVARDVVEWQNALELLVTSEDLRKAMGQAAKAVALARYGPSTVIPRAITALGLRQPPRACWTRYPRSIM